MKLLLNIFLMFVFFPYIKPFNIGTSSDIQPYAVIFGFFLCVISLVNKKNRIDNVFYIILVYITTIIVILLLITLYKSHYNTNTSDFLKGIFPYVTIIIVPWTTSVVLNKMSLNYIDKILKLVYLIWVTVGFIQMFNPIFLTGWIDRRIITTDRGSISLANEPAYFMIMLIIITLILILIDYNKNKKFIIFNIIVSILIAQNTVGLIYSTSLLIIMNISRPSFKNILSTLLVISLLLVGLFVFIYSNPYTRIATLIMNLMENPVNILFQDTSLNIRFAHLYLSFKGAAEKFFLPHGVLEWGQYYYYNVIANPQMFIEPIYRLNMSSNKIVTMHGGFIYEIGILAIPMYIFIFNKMKKMQLGTRIYIFILILGLNGLNVSNPVFCFFIGFILYMYKGGNSLNEQKIICM